MRLGSALMLMPGFMSSYVNMRLRLSIALALSFVLLPFLNEFLPAPSAFAACAAPCGPAAVANPRPRAPICSATLPV